MYIQEEGLPNLVHLVRMSPLNRLIQVIMFLPPFPYLIRTLNYKFNHAFNILYPIIFIKFVVLFISCLCFHFVFDLYSYSVSIDMSHPRWREAMREAMQVLEKNARLVAKGYT